MLDQLVKKDTLWRKTAYSICKDKFLADDLVQEMYLKLMNSNRELKDFYVVLTLRSLFIDHVKKTNRSKEKYFSDITNFETIFDDLKELDDQQQYKLDLINKKADWWQIELIELSNDYSLRELGKMYNIDHGLIFRVKQTIKKEVWEEIEKGRLKVLATQ